METAMAYLRVVLSGVAAIFVAEIAPFFLLALSMRAVSGTGEQGAIGFDPYSFRRGFVSPWCWLIAVVFFVLFLAASRLSSKALRVLLFWVPTLAISTLCALLTCTWIFLRKG
jgi:hypothetical protein